MTSYDDPVWRAGFLAWVEERLDVFGLQLEGQVTQPHVRAWGTVLRVPTTAGPVWAKAVGESLRHEVAVTALVARRRSDAVAPLLGADPQRGWLLTADAGETLRELGARERTLAPWHDALTLYASVQRDLAADAADLLAAGLPDLRLPRIPDLYADLVERIAPELGDVAAPARAAVPLVRDLCAELAATGLPDTLQHDDLHDAQVFVRDGRVRILDWGDACLTHPFLTLAVTLDGVIAWGLDDEAGSEDTAPYRDTYLAGWAGSTAAGHEELVRAADVARRLGWACRAVNGHLPRDPSTTRTRVRMLLGLQV
ncbi:hypothetical protein I601_1454 [Nocardioides dokdonensis FR1436]|uniref:Aminoglycoside phosphotransferase domain-containing protein n=1 Tax=Nocardioides dokdonensis FR1436 TaxID=1300347 RepID=A0A1A9GJN9_9ACTN|nr:phosphotransferase [Nocardioides dokdonensis]ANH37890.1 hypothetical protein I601_1454 [Nocardioides dokdonensis FR1436]